MKRRRPPRPSPAKDWRAVAADRPQRVIPLPIRTGPATAAERAPDPSLDAVRDRDVDAVVIRVRRRDDGTGYVLVVASAAFDRPADVRAVAGRLAAAADALEGAGS